MDASGDSYRYSGVADGPSRSTAQHLGPHGFDPLRMNGEHRLGKPRRPGRVDDVERVVGACIGKSLDRNSGLKIIRRDGWSLRSWSSSSDHQLWLELLRDDCAIRDAKLTYLNSETEELLAIFATIVAKIRRQQGKL